MLVFIGTVLTVLWPSAAAWWWNQYDGPTGAGAQKWTIPMGIVAVVIIVAMTTVVPVALLALVRVTLILVSGLVSAWRVAIGRVGGSDG